LTTLNFAAGAAPTLSPDRYVPGVCNIGPAEIAKRRRAGIVGSLLTLGLLVVLFLREVPLRGPGGQGASASKDRARSAA